MFHREFEISQKSAIFWTIAIIGIIYSLSIHWALISIVSSPFFQPDSSGYYIPALNLLFKGKMDIDPFRPEGYPLFLYFILKIFGSFFAVLVAQHVVQLLTALISGLFYFFFFQRSFWQSFLVGWIFSLSAEGMAYSHWIMSENLFCFTFMLSVFSLYVSLEKSSSLIACLTAVLASLTTFIRPVGTTIIASIGLSYLMFLGIKKWHVGAVYVCTIVCLLVSWSYYNKETKGFFGLSPKSGLIFYGSSAYFLDLDESIPSDIRSQLEPVYIRNRARMLNDFNFVAWAPDGPVQALSKLENRNNALDPILTMLAFKAITKHPFRYSGHLLHIIINYHLVGFEYPNYFVFPVEHMAWLGSARFWYATKSIPQARAMLTYQIPFELFSAHPEISAYLGAWRDSWVAFVRYRKFFPDPYLEKISSVYLYPFSTASIFTRWLKPILDMGSAFATIGALGGFIVMVFSRNNRRKIAPILLISFSYLLMVSTQGVDGRYALPLQPFYLVLFVFVVTRTMNYLSGLFPQYAQRAHYWRFSKKGSKTNESKL